MPDGGLPLVETSIYLRGVEFSILPSRLPPLAILIRQPLE